MSRRKPPSAQNPARVPPTRTSAGSSPPAGAATKLSRWSIATLVVFLLSAYLCLVNLDYASFWHDEAPAAFLGKQLLEQGDITGWDGRNLVGGTNGKTLNSELRDVLPPFTYFANALGFSLFGVNEIGGRIIHALMGLVALVFFHLLIRHWLPSHPRLGFLIFLFSAQSAQLLLYFRQSRYFAALVMFLMIMMYFYEKYWREKRPIFLAGLVITALFAFFNHYTGATASVLTIAAWHLIYRSKETQKKEWLMFIGGGALFGIVGLSYFLWLGIIGDGREGGFVAYTGWNIASSGGMDEFFHMIMRSWSYFLEMFRVDWLSLPVVAWFAYVAHRSFFPGKRFLKIGKPLKKREIMEANEQFPLFTVTRIIVFGLLFAGFSSILSVQRLWANPVPDLRYYFAAIPFLLAMKALFTEWLLHRRQVLAGGLVLAVLLTTNYAAEPFHAKNLLFKQINSRGPVYFQFLKEVHQPYPSIERGVADYLLRHANQDDLVYKANFYEREALIFYAGERALFCCILDQNTPLPQSAIEELRPSIFPQEPDWIIKYGNPAGEGTPYFSEDRYTLAHHVPDAPVYPTQRPEVNIHLFPPLPEPLMRGAFIYRRQ